MRRQPAGTLRFEIVRKILTIDSSLESSMKDKPMTDDTRIVIGPEICHGSPCVRGLRYPVTMILELLASGMSHSEILADYADLEEDEIRPCLQYAARLSDVKSLARIGP